MTDASKSRMPDVVFVGRANIDLTVRVPQRAGVGRSVFGKPLIVTPGGKSLNQAVAAASHEVHSCLMARAGMDSWGNDIIAELVRSGVDTSLFHLIEDAVTGAAIIEVTPDGENFITLALSPATDVTDADVTRAFDSLRPKVVVVQLDLPMGPVQELLGHRRAPVVIGNLIPTSDFCQFDKLDVFVVNLFEAAAILGEAMSDPVEAGRALRALGPNAVVVTAGSSGAAYVDSTGSGVIPAPPVAVIDTTGAGDAFLGGLAAALAREATLADAVALGVASGTEAVQHLSAQKPY